MRTYLRFSLSILSLFSHLITISTCSIWAYKDDDCTRFHSCIVCARDPHQRNSGFRWRTSAMTTSPEIQHHASEIILVSLEFCASILKNTRRPNRNPLLTSIWSKQETADLVNYLYQRRGEISEGSFPAGTFCDLAAYLNKRHPRSHRCRNLVLSRFAFVRTFLY